MALCAAIMGRMEQAQRMLRPFRFGQEFFKLNAEPIAAYQSCSSNKEVIETQWSFFDQP
jgi:ribosome biogenesis protein Tsr3